MRQRIGTHLNLVHFGTRRDAAFVVENSSRTGRCPKSPAFPTLVWIVNATIHILTEETHGIGNMDRHKLAVYKCQQGLAAVRLCDRDVWPQSQGVIPVDPNEIRVIGAARIFQALELRSRELVERPSFRTLLSRSGSRSVQRSLAFSPVEACEVPARQCRPDNTIQIEVDTARSEADIGRRIDFSERCLRRIRAW